jgi:mono/diheme cytochrome c family protein
MTPKGGENPAPVAGFSVSDVTEGTKAAKFRMHSRHAIRYITEYSRRRTMAQTGTPTTFRAGSALLVSVALGIGAAVTLHGEAGSGQAQSGAPTGMYLFSTYCASCHGTSATGNGPLASAMKVKPANLTEIAKRNAGKFDGDSVFRIIDGRKGVKGHGGSDMPVWGDAFAKSAEAGDEAVVKERIQALVDYLQTLQAK